MMQKWKKFNYTLDRYFRPVTKWLMIVNVAIFIIFVFVRLFFNPEYYAYLFLWLANIPELTLQHFQIWRLLTYSFLHADGLHLLFNMLVLFFFGSMVEGYWGSKRFLFFYLIVVIGGGLFHTLFSYLPSQDPRIPMLGSSGGMYGIMVAAAMIAPNQIVYIYGLFPLKMKHLVIGIMVIAFVMTVGSGAGRESSISHVTHLSGGAIGYLLMKWPDWWWRFRRGRIKSVKGGRGRWRDL